MSSGRNEGDNRSRARPFQTWNWRTHQVHTDRTLLPNAGDSTDQCGGCQENRKGEFHVARGLVRNAIRENRAVSLAGYGGGGVPRVATPVHVAPGRGKAHSQESSRKKTRDGAAAAMPRGERKRFAAGPGWGIIRAHGNKRAFESGCSTRIVCGKTFALK